MSQVNMFQQETIDKYGNPKEWKKMKLDMIREFHAPLIKDLGISPLDFNMKMPFYDKHGRYVVGIFSSEFLKDKGFFFELVTRELDPLEADRKVYRIARNDNFKEEFEMNEKGSFLVPVDELRIVNPQSVAISKQSAVFSNDKLFTSKPVQEQPAPQPQPVYNSKPQPPVELDAPYSEMTIRDYMAIQTGKPVSLKPWLNDLLNNTLPF
jgi:hypothetical protein